MCCRPMLTEWPTDLFALADKQQGVQQGDCNVLQVGRWANTSLKDFMSTDVRAMGL